MSDKYSKLSEDQQSTDASQRESQDFVQLKMKKLDGTTRQVNAILQQSILQFKQTYFKEELQDSKLVKIIYRGRLLKDDEIIQNINFPQDTYIHVSITNGPKQESQNDNSNNDAAGKIAAGGTAVQNINPNDNSENLNQQLQPNNNFPSDLESQLQPHLTQADMNQLRSLAMTGQQIQQQDNPQQQQQSPIVNEFEDERLLRNQGTKLDFFIGFLVGFTFQLPGLMFIFFCQFSQNARMGVFLGFSLNIIYSIFFGTSQSKRNQQGQQQQQQENQLTNNNGYNALDGNSLYTLLLGQIIPRFFDYQ